MVTAIVIPIICLYFYWLTRKEMKEQDEKWLAVNQIPQESMIAGEIKSLTEEKQRFYYHRYIVLQTLKIQTDTKIMTAKKMTPIIKNVKIDSFTTGEQIRLFGKWDGSTFLFSRFEVDKKQKG